MWGRRVESICQQHVEVAKIITIMLLKVFSVEFPYTPDLSILAWHSLLWTEMGKVFVQIFPQDLLPAEFRMFNINFYRSTIGADICDVFLQVLSRHLQLTVVWAQDGTQPHSWRCCSKNLPPTDN